jgi:hypothetical protein
VGKMASTKCIENFSDVYRKEKLKVVAAFPK